MFKKFKYVEKGTMFIFDEVQHAKNHRSQIGKTAYMKTKNADKLLLLTGDLYPQGYMDSFNPLRMIYGPRIRIT